MDEPFWKIATFNNGLRLWGEDLVGMSLLGNLDFRRISFNLKRLFWQKISYQYAFVRYFARTQTKYLEFWYLVLLAMSFQGLVSLKLGKTRLPLLYYDETFIKSVLGQPGCASLLYQLVDICQKSIQMRKLYCPY